MKTAMGVIALALGGCVSLPHCDKQDVRAEVEHISHPTAGSPWNGKYEEDWLNQLNLLGRCQSGRVYAEVGIGYKLGSPREWDERGPMYGPPVTGTVRVGMFLWQRN